MMRRRSRAGLSPRVRGNLALIHVANNLTRSIPACAGNRLYYELYPLSPRSIPACAGEPETGRHGAESTQGLSPRVRGTQIGPPSASALTVYPRVCGGTLAYGPALLSSEGLSPRVRGNLWVYVGRRPIDGSIPACAGEPMTSYKNPSKSRVYPRVCGGTPT